MKLRLQVRLSFYQKQFTQERYATVFHLLDHIPDLITEDENRVLEAIPAEQEIKKTVFKLYRNSSNGPDRLTDRFY